LITTATIRGLLFGRGADPFLFSGGHPALTGAVT